jgi:hypothetical protein
VDATGRRSINEAELMAASAQFLCPSARGYLAVFVQDLMAADTRTTALPAGLPAHCSSLWLRPIPPKRRRRTSSPSSEASIRLVRAGIRCLSWAGTFERSYIGRAADHASRCLRTARRTSTSSTSSFGPPRTQQPAAFSGSGPLCSLCHPRAPQMCRHLPGCSR